MNWHLFVYCLLFLFFLCSDLFGIDMNNPSLPAKSSGNGHVSLSGKYSMVHTCILLGSFLLY